MAIPRGTISQQVGIQPKSQPQQSQPIQAQSQENLTLEQYREQYGQAKNTLSSARQSANKELAQLGRVGYRPKGYQSKARKFYKGQKDVISQREQELSGEIFRVESEVASKNPYQALPEYKEPEYQRTKAIVQNEIQKANEKITRLQQSRKEYQEWWQRQSSEYRDKNRDSYNQRMDDYEKDIEKTQAYQRAFNETINNSKEEVIQKVNTGYVYDLADYYEQRIEDSKLKQDFLKKLEKQENTTLIYKNNKWTGQTIKTSDLPVELQGKKLQQSQIDAYNASVNKQKKEYQNYLNSLKQEGYIPQLDSKGNIVGIQDMNLGMSYAVDDKKVVSPVEAPSSTNLVTFGITGGSIFPLVSASEVKPQKISQPDITFSEVQRYQDFGYSVEDSKILARESAKRGGMSFTPVFAQELIETQKIKNQKFMDLVSGNGNEKPIFTKMEGMGGDWATGSFPISNISSNQTELSSSSKLWTITGFGINNLEPDLVGQGFSSSNQTKSSKASGQDSDGSIFGRIKSGWNWLGEKTGEFSIPLFAGVPGGEIKFKDIQSSIKQKGTETLSAFDIQKMEFEMDKEWQKQVQNLNINPYTNKWLGTSEDFEKYDKKYSEYESSKKITEEYSKGQQFKTQLIDFSADYLAPLIPVSYGQFAVEAGAVYGAWMAGSYAVSSFGAWAPSSGLGVGTKTSLQLGFKAINWAGTGFAIKEGFNEDSPILTRTMNFGFAGLGALGVADDIGKGYGWARSKFFPGRVKYVDDLSFDDAKALRDRATVLFRDKKTGKYLVELDKNTGMYITPGGAVDKGEDFLKAAQRELFEETGMKVKPSQLTFTDEFITSRERYKVFTLEVDDAKNLNLMAQAKEVQAFKWVDAPLDYTGATTAKPFGQRTNFLKFWEKSVRSDDLYAISRAGKVDDVAKQIKNLSPTQKTALTNEAKQWALNNFGAERIKGISNDKLLKDYLLNQQGGLFKQLILNPAEETFFNPQVGRDLYLRKRVQKAKITKPSTWIDYFAGRKAGQFKSFQPFSGIEVGFGSRYDVPFELLETYAGKKMTYVHASPGQIPTETNMWGELQGMKIKGMGVDETFEVFKKANQRGEGVLYFQPPTKAKSGQAYLGASYLGILDDASSGKQVKLSWWRRSPNIYTTQAKAGDDLIFTKKAMASVEFEVGALPGTVFKVSGKGSPVWLAGRKVRNPYIDLMQNAPDDIVKGFQNFANMNQNQQSTFLKQVRKRTGIDYEQGMYKFVNPSEIFGGFSGSLNITFSRSRGSSSAKSPTRKTGSSGWASFSEMFKGSDAIKTKEGYNPFAYKETPNPYKESKPSYKYKIPGLFPPYSPYEPNRPKQPRPKMIPKWGMNQFKQKRKQIKGKSYDREYEYAPSLTSVLLGITSKKAPKQKIFGGFEWRPIIVNTPTKRRRKKRR